jgi:hypothetical protein
MQCGGRKTLVILDECHHIADRRAWGEAIRHAFEVAEYRLSLSGTLFRQDGRRIPFVNFVDGVSRPDYSYGYARAVEEKVCRPIYFRTYDGRVVYLREGGEERQEHFLHDVVDRTTAGERLRAALDSDQHWLRKVVADADATLTSMREAGQPDAGGLIVTMHQLHAKRVTQMVAEVTGEEPVLIISDDPDAAQKASAFARGTQRWAVAVRMVSEGADIPRLRVGVFATHVRSELFFHQFCGRFLRVVRGLREQSAVVFLPLDERLVSYALDFKVEREYVLSPDDEGDSEDRREGEPIGVEEWGEHLVRSLSATPVEHDTVFDGASFPQPELTFAAQAAREMGITAPWPHAAALIRLGAEQAGVFIRRTPQVDSAGSRTNQGAQSFAGKALLKRTTLVAQNLARLDGNTADEIHREWVGEGGMPPEIATHEDLERKLAWMERRISDVVDSEGHKIGDSFFSLKELRDGLSVTPGQKVTGAESGGRCDAPGAEYEKTTRR